ncbi:hypothetical protein PLICRDRAFT_102438 [Plicaturopsis crispa FD-325 SS-3]|nr:hypothetical protein PLICRDRAFT_102438 [Plicaturopsis crispa FD-325 SS-3]
MEHYRPARSSSGVYDTDIGTEARSIASGSQASLGRDNVLTAGSLIVGNAEDMAHDAPPVPQRTTAAGVPVTGAAAGAAAADASGSAKEGDAAAPAAAATAVKPPFYRQKWFKIANAILIPIGIALLFILLYPVVKAVSQLVLNRAVLNVDTASISSPQNDTFQLGLNGVVTHTGIFSATIEFQEPLNVSWVYGDEVIPIGTMPMQTIHAHSKRAYINETTTFSITDQDAFGKFAAYMITAEAFTWRLHTSSLRVQAMKFPWEHGLKMTKDVTLKGIHSFDGNVALKSLSLPSDNPAGGIDFVATTTLNNPSPFALGLGTVVFDLTTNGTYIGTGTGKNVSIVPGSNDITLSGILVPQTSTKGLADVSQLFTNYINSDVTPVLATGQSTLQNDGSAVSWLSQGLKSLTLSVPFTSPSPINPIQSINIGYLTLGFAAETPWQPSIASDAVQAAMKLPFGFGLSVNDIQNDFNITKNALTVAGLSTPLGASKSAVKVLGPTDTEGQINITIANTNLSTTSANYDTFSLFNGNLTDLAYADFRLVGNSRAVANMSVGQITLDPIKVNVSTGLGGLKGLNGYVTINNVDVTGGTSDYIELGINVTIVNPSQLNLYTEDLSLQLGRNGQYIGTTLLPNLTINMGKNVLAAKGFFQPNLNSQGGQTLNDFVGQRDVEVGIAGYEKSTNITSLLHAFQTLNISAILPGLKQSLLDSTALKVLSTTGRENNISHVTVDLANPFTAGLEITKISSTVSSHGLNLGSIEMNTNFSSPGKQKTTSPLLDLNMNFDPPTLFTLTRVLAVEAGLDVAPLDGIVQLGNIQYVQATSADSKRSALSRRNLYTGFNLPTFVQGAFKKLRSDVNLTAGVTIGGYSTTLEYQQESVQTLTDDSLNYILPVLAQPIVQKIVTGSVLGLETVLISNPGENSFTTKLTGSITNAGPFDATIHFGSGLTVAWSGKPLGTIKMSDVKLSADVGATLDLESAFEVADVDHLTDFTKTLLTAESFDWDISGENLTSEYCISVDSINLTTKSVTLKGMNGLKNGVKINSFDLPANDPAGGIHLTIQSEVTNPSQVGVSLSSIGFNAFYGDTNLGPVASTNSFTLTPGGTTSLPLAGRLQAQTASSGLADVSTVFNNFIHGKDSNVSVTGTSAGPSDVTWLNTAIKSLQVATVLPNQGVLNIIKSISLDQLQLMFSEDSAYAPPTGSNQTEAAFTIPFNFPIDITALEQNITVGYQGSDFAELVIPKGPSTTDVQQRIIHLTFANVPFAGYSDKHSVFNDFLAATTMGSSQTISLAGNANTEASTAVGVLSLTDIAFSVDTTIKGLQGLTAKPALVSNLDVNHGYSDYLLIKVDTALYNPSNLTIGTGDVSFGLQFQGQTIGSAGLSNMIIKPGNLSYPTDVKYSPQGGAVSAGQALLENYLQGVNSDTTILGSTESTPIASLQEALSEIKLTPVTIPALHQNLITSASLTFPIDIVKTGIAQSDFSLANPFTASINLLQVTATAIYQDLMLGKIDHVSLSFHADGHSNETSSKLPLNFNLDPVTIVKLVTYASQEHNVDIGPLTDLFKIVLQNPNGGSSINTSVDTNAPTCVSGKQFDIDDAILNSLKGLEVTLEVQSSVKLDDYATDLAFNQSKVPAITDKTALYLIGAVSRPIAQTLVDSAVLKFTEANITNLANDGFDLSLSGSLTDVGPLDVVITFVEGVDVTWQGNKIATIALPPACAAANAGLPEYTPKGHLTITDQDQFTTFATYLLHNEEFEWTISTDKLRLNALGTIFDNVSLSKKVSFKAFNGLPGVTISNFELPGDYPGGGITIATDADIPSPAQLGIDLGTVGFDAYFDNTLVGPLSGDNLFLAASTTTKASLSGHIIPQSGSDLDTIGTLFSKFLAGDNQTLSVKGSSVQPSGSSEPVSWLSTAFKTLTLDVILPGHKYTIIQSIALNDLSIEMTSQDEAYAPLAGSNYTLAEYKNPFGFSLQVIESAVDMVISMGGTDTAHLKLPKAPTVGGVSTGNVADLVISFEKQTLQSVNDGAFQSLFQTVTDKTEADLNLNGTADVTAKTSIGDVPIAGIPFSVPSSLKGINGFGGNAPLSNVSITGSGGNGGNQYITAPLLTTLENPSNVSLQTVDIALPVYYSNVMIGRAAIDPFNLVPGTNKVPAVFHYGPDNANDTTAQSFLTDYLQSAKELALTIKGDGQSSPFGSLQPALEGIELHTSLTGINAPPIITHVSVGISVSTLFNNMVETSFDIYNPINADLKITFAQADAKINGETYANFDQPFASFVVPPGQTVNSGTFGNVLLPKGALASLAIIPLGYLDISCTTTVE